MAFVTRYRVTTLFTSFDASYALCFFDGVRGRRFTFAYPVVQSRILDTVVTETSKI